jgi:organic radical activating enzyme
MKKKNNESLQEYQKRVLDSKSKSFCGAKWYNATTWLGNGTTASCHHPPAHYIPLEELQQNYTAIHNTKHKKMMRKMMQDGDRPSECEYCWRIEDMNRNSVSDRVFKSVIYTEDDLKKAYDLDHNADVNLKTFEIAFDRTCNLACSYCNASFSTTWAKDINKNGPYENLVSDGAGAFHHNGSWAESFTDDNNPYIQAFWKWWDNGLSTSLDELRITGGEPLMSKHVWKLIDWFQEQNSDMRFAINTNLIAKDSIIDKLIDKSKNIKNFEIYTSCEATGLQAEYIRDGLSYSQWKKNLLRINNEANVKGLHIMMTINSLCLFSITDFLDEIYEIKEQNNSVLPNVSVNLLRFPSFQSPLALPNHIKDFCRTNLLNWYNKNKEKKFWTDYEKASIERLIDYLEIVDAPHRRTSNKITLWRDFKSFYAEYDKRRNKSIEVFPKILTEWIEQIPSTIIQNDKEFLEIAIAEGWILKPDNKNIADPLQKYK